MVFSNFLVKRFKAKQNWNSKLFYEVLYNLKGIFINIHIANVRNSSIKIILISSKSFIFPEFDLGHDFMELFIRVLVLIVFHWIKIIFDQLIFKKIKLLYYFSLFGDSLLSGGYLAYQESFSKWEGKLLAFQFFRLLYTY